MRFWLLAVSQCITSQGRLRPWDIRQASALAARHPPDPGPLDRCFLHYQRFGDEYVRSVLTPNPDAAGQSVLVPKYRHSPMTELA